MPSLSGSAISLFNDKVVSKIQNCRLVHENIMIFLVIKVAHRNLNLFFFIFNVAKALSKDKSDRVNKGSRAN